MVEKSSAGVGLARDRVRIGFVGAGFMGQIAHISRYAQLADCDAVALVEPRVKTAELVAARYGIGNTYASLPEMLAAETLDGVVLVQQYRHHHVLLPLLLGAVPHVFVEKPLCLNPSTGRELVAQARASGTTVMVGYHKRCDPATVEARRLLGSLREGGSLGAMTAARVTVPDGDWEVASRERVLDAGDAPVGDALELEPFAEGGSEHEGGARKTFIGYFIHQLNLARHLVGGPLEVAYADPTGHVLVLTGADDVPIVIEMTPYAQSLGWGEHAIVMFERGYVRLDPAAPLAVGVSGRLELFQDVDSRTRLSVEALPPHDAMTEQARAFLAVCRGEQAPPCDAAEALADLVLCNEAFARRARQSLV